MKLSFVTTAAVAILATGASADVQYWCGVLADKCSKDTPAGTLGLPATAECGEKVFRKKGKWVGEKKMWVITGMKKLDKNWPKFKKCCHDDKMYDGRNLGMIWRILRRFIKPRIPQNGGHGREERYRSMTASALVCLSLDSEAEHRTFHTTEPL
jgi:hypothetical protein